MASETVGLGLFSALIIMSLFCLFSKNNNRDRMVFWAILSFVSTVVNIFTYLTNNRVNEWFWYLAAISMFVTVGVGVHINLSYPVKPQLDDPQAVGP